MAAPLLFLCCLHSGAAAALEPALEPTFDPALEPALNPGIYTPVCLRCPAVFPTSVEGTLRSVCSWMMLQSGFFPLETAAAARSHSSCSGIHRNVKRVAQAQRSGLVQGRAAPAQRVKRWLKTCTCLRETSLKALQSEEPSLNRFQADAACGFTPEPNLIPVLVLAQDPEGPIGTLRDLSLWTGLFAFQSSCSSRRLSHLETCSCLLSLMSTLLSKHSSSRVEQESEAPAG